MSRRTVTSCSARAPGALVSACILLVACTALKNPNERFDAGADGALADLGPRDLGPPVACGDAALCPSDPSLISLVAGPDATLSPPFFPTTTLYTLTLPRGATFTTLTPTATQSTATITVGAMAVASGVPAEVSADYTFGSVDVVVTAPDGATTRSYTVNLQRGPPVYVKASNPGVADVFGQAVSLSADGTHLAVGAQYEDSAASGIDGDQASDTASAAGAVYVYAWSGATWVQEAYIKPSNTDPEDHFGYSLALSADGLWLAVGSINEDSSATGVNGNGADDGSLQSGAVYVFSRAGSLWTERAYVKASNTDSDDKFGSSVSLSADGTWLAVGAITEDSSAMGVGFDEADNSAFGSGAVYVFSRSGGSTWAQDAYIKASNTDANDEFGGAVSLSADGMRLAVGAYHEGSAAIGVGGDQLDDTAPGGGAVYVFSRASGLWAQEAYIKASNTGANDEFGASVSLSGDGMHLAVGAQTEDSGSSGIGGIQADERLQTSGAVYVYSWSGAAWAQDAYVKASNPGADDRFGVSVSLSADGARLAVGAFGENSTATGIGGPQDNEDAGDSGAAYLFTRSGGTWVQAAYVKASNTDPADEFGWCVALSGDGARLAVGAPWESSGAVGVNGDEARDDVSQSGAVYVY